GFASGIDRRQSHAALQRADLTADAHAVAEQAHDVRVDALDVLATLRQRVAAHAATPALIAAGMVRPAARAKGRNRCITFANASCESDWSPSDSAFSGSGCTSMMSPSAPAAIAAKASGATSSASPPAWLGSTITGKCVSRLSTGIAETSSVLRV